MLSARAAITKNCHARRWSARRAGWSRDEFTAAVGATVAEFRGAGLAPSALIATDQRPEKVGGEAEQRFGRAVPARGDRPPPKRIE